MRKLAFSTLGCPAWPLNTLLKNAQDMGFSGVELRGIAGEMAPEKIAALMPGQQRATLRAFAAHGLTITNLGTSVRFDDKAKWEAMLTQGYIAIDVCYAMNIPAIRVFGDAITDLSRQEETIALVADGMRALCDYAKGSGVEVWQESHGQFNTLERLSSVVQQVDRDSFGILWDVQHTDKIYADDFETFYAPLRAHIRHVHIKDHLRSTGPEPFALCLPGQGDIPLRALLARLAADGFGGWLSFEWEKVWHPELPEPEIAFPQYIDVMNHLMA